jgi:cytochrome c5
MRRVAVHVLILAGLLALILAGQADADKRRSAKMDLQALPARTSAREVNRIMKVWSQALGVSCDACHAGTDYARDTEAKTVSRAMVRMTQALNRGYFKGYGLEVTCETCHRGKLVPARAP